MCSLASLFRIAAAVILLLTGVELITCEVLSPVSCEISGIPGDRSTDSGDDCLCCCFHIVVKTPLVIRPNEEAVPLEPVPQMPVSSLGPPRIYHPPRAA